MKNWIVRNMLWIGIIGLIAFIIGPAISEYRTVLITIMIECVALALSGLCVYAFTKLDFIKEKANSILGQIFLGVHICTGLSVLSVYFMQ